jgi:hypothetical protein
MGAAPCPYPLEPNNNQGWLGREPTQDEIEVVEWLKRSSRVPRRILHIGVGTALLSREFGDRVAQGVTKDGAEAENARAVGLDVIVCNKYQVAVLKPLLKNPFDCIVDVNIRSYACCDSHFREFMDAMLVSLSRSGMLLTSRRGLEYLVPTSLADLRTLCPRWRVRAHGNVVVMRPGYAYRFRQLVGR